jgi:hypothetical protein
MLGSTMDFLSRHLDDAQPSAEGRHPFARLGTALGRLVGREPGFEKAEMRLLSAALTRRIDEAEATPPMTGDDVYRVFVQPVIDAQVKYFEDLARTQPRP